MMLNAFLMSLSMLLLMSAPQSSEAAKEPLCTYRNSEGETIFLTYMPLSRKGEDYVDFGTDGKCLKRAICTDTFKTIVEDCAQQKVTCHNKQRYTGVFPACCIKCK
ncbi:uncharacterized protein LOC117575161 [Drosophila albomicans]|uniref:Uncharacterized protein LOC117575161 n=1 Tax=Drosophila albomicans TaxID=7291 RepID=A0A6P8XPT7_DROAB|nr:uncharacterized protein LOC117575161 [Drosophila albomicans]